MTPTTLKEKLRELLHKTVDESPVMQSTEDACVDAMVLAYNLGASNLATLQQTNQALVKKLKEIREVAYLNIDSPMKILKIKNILNQK